MPSGTEALTAAARVEDEDAIVWRGDPELPEVEQGIRLLGTPLGHPIFVEDQLARLTTSHRVLLERIHIVSDLQVAWLIGLLRSHAGQLRVEGGASPPCSPFC